MTVVQLSACGGAVGAQSFGAAETSGNRAVGEWDRNRGGERGAKGWGCGTLAGEKVLEGDAPPAGQLDVRARGSALTMTQWLQYSVTSLLF